ncbi:MAG: tetratricopeptide repeat protein [Siphonobacter sp.]
MRTFLVTIGLLLFASSGFTQTKAIDPWSEIQELSRKADYAKMIPLLEKLAEKDTANRAIPLQIAVIQQKLGRWGQAKKVYETILKQEPNQIEALNQLALLAEKDYQYAKALTYYQKLIQLDSTNAFFYKQGAFQHVKLSQALKAIPYYQKALKINQQDLESVAELARIYLDEYETQKAISYIDLGLSIDSNSVRILQLDSRASFRMEAYERTVTDIEKTMALGDSAAYFQRLVGIAYYQIDSLQKSLRTFNRLLKVGDNSEPVHSGLGNVYLLLAKKDTAGWTDHYMQALKHFKEAEQLALTRVPDYQMGIADVYALGKKNWSMKTAIQSYQKIYNEYKRPRALYRLGELYEKLEPELSSIYYKEVIDLCSKLNKDFTKANPIHLQECTCTTTAKERLKLLKVPNPPTLLSAEKPVVQDSSLIAQDTTDHHK